MQIGEHNSITGSAITSSPLTTEPTSLDESDQQTSPSGASPSEIGHASPSRSSLLECDAAHDPLPSTGLERGITVAWNHLKNLKNNTALRVVRGRTQIGDTLDDGKGTSNLPMLSQSAQTVNDALQTFSPDENLHQFTYGIPDFLIALEAVKMIHPFIGIAVDMFKEAYSFEHTRQKNDDKLVFLFLQMKEMLGELLQLENVKEVKTMTPDGTPLDKRIALLCALTADDIKKCCNACEAYGKQSLLGKTFKGPLWNKCFTSFVGLFAKRREEFRSALMVQTVVGIDMVQESLRALGISFQGFNQKVDAIPELVLQTFQLLSTQEEARATVYINHMGGPDAFDTDAKLLELLKNRPELAVSDFRPGSKELENPEKLDAEKVLAELKEDIEVAQDRNMAKFLDQLKRHETHIIGTMEQIVRKESDRVIMKVSAGPYEEINDKTLSKLWRDSRWPEAAPAREFIARLCDYYHDKQAKGQETRGEGNEDDPGDSWTYAYIHKENLQPLLEAFDDDHSNSMTVVEVNKFTESLPPNWSLPLWIAYWAVGWKMAVCDHVSQIKQHLQIMLGMLPNLAMANRGSAYRYLQKVWQDTYTVIASVNALENAPPPQPKYQSYEEADIARVRKHLETVRYDLGDIKNFDTLSLGRGNIEKQFFPLVNLLLRHHLGIFRICRERVVDPVELMEAARAIGAVRRAFETRYQDLKKRFARHNHGGRWDSRFESFAGGFFKYIHEPQRLWSTTSMRQMPNWEEIHGQFPHEDRAVLNFLGHEKEDEDIISYPYDETGLLGGHRLSHPATSTNIILGTWNYILYIDSIRRATDLQMPRFMQVFTLQATSPPGNGGFFGSGASYCGTPFTISGSCSITPGDIVSVSFQLTFQEPSGRMTVHHHGQLCQQPASVAGTWSVNEGTVNHKGRFLLTRVSSQIVRFRPSPMLFEGKKARTFWVYALTVVRNQVRERLWSWSLLRERRDLRRKFLDLAFRKSEQVTRCLSDEEETELERCGRLLTYWDLRAYHACLKYGLLNTPLGSEECISCGENVSRARIICLECEVQNHGGGALNLCTKSHCATATISSHNRPYLVKPHLPSHDVMKVPRPLLLMEYGKVCRSAVAALAKARCKIDHLSKMDKGLHIIDASVVTTTPQTTDMSLMCVVCNNDASLPCWYCVECPVQPAPFVCTECAAKCFISSGAHRDYHILVKCQVLAASSDDDEGVQRNQQLAAIDGRLSRMEERLQNIDNRQVQIQGMLETLLQQLTGKTP